MGAGGGAAAGGVLAAELCAPLLLLCWLCCWPDDASDSSSSGHPRKPVLANEGRRRSGGLRARLAGSAASLHLPGPSAGSPARSGTGFLSTPAHRSHEELVSAGQGAPGVLREVLLRRDWDRSARDLYIPLRPDPAALGAPSPPSPPSPSAPRASPDSPPSDAGAATPRCKKHHSNIKSSRGKERRAAASERDEESPSRFYIGDEADNDSAQERPLRPEKEEKQCLNESIRSKERPWRLPGAPAPAADELGAMDELDWLDAPDRSGAVHHALDSRAAAGYPGTATLSPVSVDAVGYEYLGGADGAGAGRGALAGAAPGAARARHASDGDILAPAPRPESGAFSESDLDLELRLALQAEELQQGQALRGGGARGECARADRRETAI